MDYPYILYQNVGEIHQNENSCTLDKDMRLYPGIENLILPMLSYPGCHVRASNIGCIGTHANGRQVTSLLC